MTVPDFDSFTSEQQFADYLASSQDHSAFLAWMRQRGTAADPKVAVTVASADDQSMKVTSIRLPQTQLVELDQFAGRSRDGRSGLIREAIDYYLAHLKETA